MKTIMNILLCLAIAAGMVSCGMGDNKKEEGKLTRKEKKEVKKALDDLSDKVEIKGDKVIRTTKGLGATSITTYHFTGDKCTRLVIETKFPSKKTAEELHAGLKESGSLFENVKMEGNTVTYEQSGDMVEFYSEYTKKSLRDKLQKEIDESKEFMESIKDKL